MPTIEIKSPTEVERAAAEFVSIAGTRKFFAFYGEMGSGKTTLIKAICYHLGVSDTVNSPSFSIINEYRTAAGESIFHFDFYRIKNLEEALDTGFEEYFYRNSWCFIEWPEKIESMLPDFTIPVQIKVMPDETRIVKIG
jgi:tRNA threonylcarbamoyladenosine biosynthesis protein TsaE